MFYNLLVTIHIFVLKRGERARLGGEDRGTWINKW